MTTGEAQAGRVEPSADVDPTAVLGPGVRVWHLAQVRERAHIGESTTLGRGSYVGPGVVIGANCKIQNYALLYEPAILADGVFIGPAAVFTNDEFPRAITPDGALKQSDDWTAVGVSVKYGASIGARAVCIAPVVIGEWALVAAGAVVTRDVPDHGIVAGIPARHVGWVGRAGIPLEDAGGGVFTCPATHERYRLVDGFLTVDPSPSPRSTDPS
jgi:UDP-2-acetamido-3-amino-2,3-dideoxy-glucuronate N-acetyltransferase